MGEICSRNYVDNSIQSYSEYHTSVLAYDIYFLAHNMSCHRSPGAIRACRLSNLKVETTDYVSLHQFRALSLISVFSAHHPLLPRSIEMKK